MGQDNGRSFIAMEYVEGQTLKEKLEQGPLELKDALEIATEIAEALETAHKANIVHRDLKPANLMLTPDGHVKVLDFGLAKAMEEEAPPEDIHDSPTISQLAAKGKPVDSCLTALALDQIHTPILGPTFIAAIRRNRGQVRHTPRFQPGRGDAIVRHQLPFDRVGTEPRQIHVVVETSLVVSVPRRSPAGALNAALEACQSPGVWVGILV